MTPSVFHIPPQVDSGIATMEVNRMARRASKPGGDSAGEQVRRQKYKGHEIVYPSDERRQKIFIDGRPVAWGETGGTYFLDVYAYDRGRSLEDTVKRYIDYLEESGREDGKEDK
jgi:hypothetical protein